MPAAHMPMVVLFTEPICYKTGNFIFPLNSFSCIVKCCFYHCVDIYFESFSVYKSKGDYPIDASIN